MSQPDAVSVARLLEEYLAELQRGTAPDRSAFLALHPGHAAALAPALDGLEFVHGALRTLPRTADPTGVDIGAVLGDFRPLREIGRGGMGVVYEAEQISLGRRVALKVLPFASVLDPRQRERFKNEALAAARLQHPRIVPIHAVGCERGIHYYAMQYIEGGSLAGAISEMRAAGGRSASPLSVHATHREPGYIRTAATFGRQAAEALDHAHQLGIVHRDVKPANLLLDRTGGLWVADFGLARSLKDVGLTITGELVGTVRYMSPEQALTQRLPVDHRTDVYSLGATLYELLTLQPPFPGDDLHALIQDIATVDPIAPRRLNPALPIDLETVLLKAMAKDPAARYATAQELADDLDRWLRDRPILAQRPSLTQRTRRWTRRHRPLLAACLTVLFVGTVALTIGTRREQRNTNAALVKAEANLGLAYRAVHEFLMFAGSQRYHDQSKCTPDLALLLQDALTFYDTYLAQHRSAPGHADRSYILNMLGRTEEALAAADQAIAIDPRLPPVWFARGTALHRLGQNDQALAALDQARALAPGVSRFEMQRGVVLKALGRTAEAIAALDHAIQIDPSSAMALVDRAALYVEHGEHERALEYVGRAVEAAPNMANAWQTRSIALAWLRRYEEALEAIERAIALQPDNADYHMHKGAVCAESGARSKALAEYGRAIRLDARLGRAYYNRSVLLQDDPATLDDAIRDLETSIDLEPTYLPARGNLGVLLLNKGAPDRALLVFEEILVRDARFTSALCGKAQILALQGRVAEALAAYRAALETDARRFDALVNCASMLNHLGSWPEALDMCRLALEVRAHPMIHQFQCIALCQLGRHAEALAAIEIGLALDDKNGESHRQKGACLQALGRWQEALTAYDQALARGQRSPGFLNQFAWTLATSTDPQRLDPARAVQLAAEAVSVAHTDANFWNTLGIARCRAGQWQEASLALEKSVDLGNGGTPFDWLFLAMARWQMGDEAQARSWYGKAVSELEATHKLEDPELARFRAEAAAMLGIR